MTTPTADRIAEIRRVFYDETSITRQYPAWLAGAISDLLAALDAAQEQRQVITADRVENVRLRDLLAAESDQLTTERAARQRAEQERDAARTFIDRYGQHDEECNVWDVPGQAPVPCDCGFDAAHALLAQEEKQ